MLPAASAARVLARPGSAGSSSPSTPPSLAVVGAGCVGGLSAIMLRRRGARGTRVDAWGPGNSRARSGGETRVIRGVYGPDRIYTAMARRAFELWHENEARWKQTLYTRTGAL